MFNKVLLWKPVVEESCDFVDPWNIFVGHEVSFFSQKLKMVLPNFSLLLAFIGPNNGGLKR